MRSGSVWQAPWPACQVDEVRRRPHDPLRRPMQRLRQHSHQARTAQARRAWYQGWFHFIYVLNVKIYFRFCYWKNTIENILFHREKLFYYKGCITL